jgi:photosystem II stability/assembly factor-like uncharacterized protein
MDNRSWKTRLLVTAAVLSSLLWQACSDSKTITPDGPLISLSHTTLSFSATAGSVPNPAARRVTVANVGTGALTFSVSTTSPWLELGPVTSVDFFVTVRSENLATGTYQDTVRVTSGVAGNSPQFLVINLVVVEQLAANPAQVQFSAVSGGQAPAPQYVQLTPSGGVNITFAATPVASWITVDEATGASPDSIAVGVTTAGLAGGIYTSAVTVTSPDVPDMRLSIPVRLALSSWLKRQPYDSAGSSSFELRGVAFADNLHGWAAGFLPDISNPVGAFFYTTDGAESWQRSFDAPAGKFEAVEFVSPNRGFVTGDSGRLFISRDAGVTWDPVSGFPHASRANLIDITFAGHDSGWVVGTGGVILATTDSGATWTAQSSPVSDDLYGVWFVDALNGWICGNQGKILHTSDGGVNWTSQSSGVTAALRGISFGSASMGIACGSMGVVLRTNNGGASWQAVATGLNNQLLEVFLVSSTTGWIVGSNGLILRTVDGGATWERQLSETDQALFHVHFTDENFGVAVGARGMILKTVGGGF